MAQAGLVLLLVSGILLVLLGLGQCWKPFAWLTLGASSVASRSSLASPISSWQ
jgi:hypothetical protein